MAPKKAYTLKIDVELIDAIRSLKESVGIPESEQIRRGIVLWLRSQGVALDKPVKRTRAAARSRSDKQGVRR